MANFLLDYNIKNMFFFNFLFLFLKHKNLALSKRMQQVKMSSLQAFFVFVFYLVCRAERLCH